MGASGVILLGIGAFGEERVGMSQVYFSFIVYKLGIVSGLNWMRVIRREPSGQG